MCSVFPEGPHCVLCVVRTMEREESLRLALEPVLRHVRLFIPPRSVCLVGHVAGVGKVLKMKMPCHLTSRKDEELEEKTGRVDGETGTCRLI